MFKKYFLLSLILVVIFSLWPIKSQALVNNLLGRILINVEKNGEAWYVNPSDRRRYFLGRPDDAFKIMRELGLGISQADWKKIPDIDDEDDKEGIDLELTKRLSGRIILQVEENGEALYINPVDLKKYFLGRPADAFNIMRDLGLRITRANLARIHKPELSESLDNYSNYEHRKLQLNGLNYSLDIVEIDLKNPNLNILTLTADKFQAKSLADYVFSNDGLAGLTGTYFCTAPSCGGLNYYFFPVYDSLKEEFINEDQLKYWTTGPLVAFDMNNRFYYFKDSRDFKSQVDFESSYGVKLQAAIGNKPRILEQGMNVLIDWEVDTGQMDSRHRRNALAYREDENNLGQGKIYLISLAPVSLNELVLVLQYLGLDYALNIDGGHSSALIYNDEYMLGPGRNIPNAIVFSQ
jgi:hypothetical protein